MNGEDIKNRTKDFTIRILTLTSALPKESTATIISDQLVRAATSVGANYRAASRAKLRRDFISKMKTVEEELDETSYWLELIVNLNYFSKERISTLMSESGELLAIIVASIITARRNEKKK
jgi:four helix bundle protein